MGKFYTGKVSVWVLTASLLLVSFFLGKTFANVSAKPVDGWGNWYDTSSCIASECGTTSGTKDQARDYTETICDLDCPSVQFSASQNLYQDDTIQYGSWGNWSACESGNYCSESDEDAGRCEDDKCHNNPSRYERRYRTVNHICPTDYTYAEVSGPNDCYKTETFGPITVQYGDKSADKNHCHKPTPESLSVPSWARGEYGSLQTELSTIQTNCHSVVTNTENQTIRCNDAEMFECGIDVCSNLDGDQETLPSGMEVVEENFCQCKAGYYEVNSEGKRVALDGLSNFTCEPEATPTPDPDVCKNIDGIQTSVPEGQHLDASGLNCVNWSGSGPAPRNDEATGTTGTVLGASTAKGRVLGATTMAGTGSFAEVFYQAIMGVGATISAFGIKGLKKSKKAN